MKKSILILFAIILLIGISSEISLADDSVTSHITASPEITDRKTFHVARYKSDTVIQTLGLVNDNLLASFSVAEHAWFFKNTFSPVNGTDPAKALGYANIKTSDSLRGIPKKSPCEKIKDVISSVVVTDTKTLCLSSTAGGDFTLRLLPATKDKPISIGFGKQPILEKTRVSWIGYDGNLYIAYLHPSFFLDDVTALKSKTNPTVFLLRNGLRYSIPNEKTFYTWFDSFKSVSVMDAKKLATYPLQEKSTFRPNTLIQFENAPDIYVYQPANSPYLKFGKNTKIIEDKKDKWIIQDTKKKTETMTLEKRPELLRRMTSETDALNTFGPNWKTQIVVLDANLKEKFSIAEKDFVPTKDIVYE